MPLRHLKQLLDANPGSVLQVSADFSWVLFRKSPVYAPDNAEEAWLKENTIASGADLNDLAAAGIALEVEDV